MQLVVPTFGLQAVWWRAMASTALGVVGQLMFRRFGMSQAELSWPLDAVPQGLGWLVIGGLCYVIAVLLWVNVLQKLSLARAYPLLSLGYPLVYIGAIVWLGEAPTLARTAGTLLVCIGVLLAVAPAPATSAAADTFEREGAPFNEQPVDSLDP